ncbi:MAG: mucoidy inhibitor MuiA family protein [Planctomycetaceae bacterium]
MYCRIQLCLLFMTCILTGALAQDTPPVEPSDGVVADQREEATPAAASKITSVTLYRDQALVTRVIPLEPGEGMRTVFVANLPELLVADSVYAEGDDQVSIRAVRVSSRQQAMSGRDEVRELETELEGLQSTKQVMTSELEVLQKNLDSLDQMISFTASTSRGDLNVGALDAEVLTQLVEFSMEKRAELASSLVGKRLELEELQKRTDLATRRLQQLTSSKQTNVFEAKVFVEVKANEPSEIRLSYLVGGCGWSPQYNVRGELQKPTIELRYSALVQQMSGENWDGVNLTLSTASPTVSAAGPMLTPFRVQGTTSPPQPETPASDDIFGQQMVPAQEMQSGEALSGKLQSLKQQQRSAEAQVYGPQKPENTVQRDLALNSIAGQMQQLELLAEAKSAGKMSLDHSDDVASQVYALPDPVSLESRRDQQLVQIAEATLNAELYHVATPLLSSYAYREALIFNDQAIGLLGGPAMVYLDGRFVGRTTIPTTASRQRVVVGFGADQQVRTRRELRAKEDDVQGGNRRLTFSYRLVVSNFKDVPVKIRLMDRMPITEQQQQVSVTLVDPGQPISEDPLYNRIQKSLGILRWDLDIPAARNGADAFDVDYKYTIEFDRSRQLTTSEMQRQMQQDYYELQLPAGMGGAMFGN